jgi:hypothetical protein
MADNLWTKAATAAFGLLTLVAGWGLAHLVNVTDPKIVEVDKRVTIIDTKLDIWMTPAGKASATSREWAPDEAHIFYASMPLRGDQGTEFARKTMIRAADQLLQKDLGGALQTLLVGLENTGSPCFVAGDHIECK